MGRNSCLRLNTLVAVSEGFQRMVRFPPIETLEDEKRFNQVLTRQVSGLPSTLRGLPPCETFAREFESLQG